MLVESVRALLRAERLPRLVFLFGEEEFLVEETADAIVAAAQQRGVQAVDIEFLDGEELSVDELVRRAEAFPMASPERVLVVRRFDRISFGRKGSSNATLFERYLRAPSPTTILVMLSTDSRVAGDELRGLAAAFSNPKQRAKAEAKLAKLRFPFNVLLEQAAWMEFPRLYERQIPEWIVQRFKAHGYQCSVEVAEYLLMQVGTSLRDLANEVSKVMLYVGERKRITLDDALSVAGASRVYNVFELQKAIGERDLSRALKILHYLVRTERQELLIVAMLARYFLLLWRLQELQQTISSTAELGRILGISPFFVPEYQAALKRYSAAELERALTLLHEADVQLKTSSVDALTVLERAVVRIVRGYQKTTPLPEGSGAV